MYDLAIIGAGWAGFNAALKAKELGLSVCLIDSGKIGGTCLNSGCIPTKTLIACAKLYALAKKSPSFGIESDNLRLNFSAIQEKKNKVVAQLTRGMQSRLSGIEFINSAAQIKCPQEIKVDGRTINAKFILVATGSQPAELEQLKFNQKNILSSDDVLALDRVPESLLIIGAGAIGCEFASLFSGLGAQVTLAEKMPRLLAGEDQEVSRKIESIFNKKGIKVITEANLSGIDLNNYSKILVCVGRCGRTAGLGLEEAGVRLNNNKIIVDDYLKSTQDTIYAAGDCTAKVMLAHYAAYQGILAVENMFSGRLQKADNPVVPNCIFTDPQIASVGVKENDALDAGLKIKVRKFDFRANAMAQINDETEGWVKIIVDQESGQVIGASIVGPQAAELIATLTLAISRKLTESQIRAVIFAHPTFSESLHEALK
jgi:dihydrolipoamide dehydrogenase